MDKELNVFKGLFNRRHAQFYKYKNSMKNRDVSYIVIARYTGTINMCHDFTDISNVE